MSFQDMEKALIQKISNLIDEESIGKRKTKDGTSWK